MKLLNRPNQQPILFFKSPKNYLLSFCILSCIIFVSIFFITRGETAHTSELSYIEYSVYGKDFGSMIPASCNSSPPTSHFAGDCVTTCPGGVGTYDPYFDPWQTGCPVPSVSMAISPTTVDYGQGYNSLSLASYGASTCYLYYAYAGDSAWSYAGQPPVNWTWGPSGGLGNTLSYMSLCYNGASSYAYSNVATVYVKPSIPTSPQAVCNNAQATNASVSWGGSANANLGYYLRIEFPASQACPAGWQRGGTYGNTCYPNPDDFYATNYTFTTIPGQSYSWWVHGRNSYTYSDAVGTTFTCNQPSGSITLSAPNCQIAVGSGSCTVNASWSTTNPYGGNISTLTRDKPNRTDYSQNSGSNLPITIYGPPSNSPTTISLNNSAINLDNKTVSTSCAGKGWDSINGVCADPEVVMPVILVGQYYPPGRLTFSCLNSTGFTVLRNGTTYPGYGTTTYTGQVVINGITDEAQYIARCTHGNVIDDKPVYYDAVPDAPTVNLDTDTTTIDPDEPVVLTWDTTFPTDQCTLTASVVCANNACTADQLAASSSLNTILMSSNTDANDPSTSRPMSLAITRPAPGHKDIDTPVINADYRALGKKTLQIKYTTDFTYNCNGTKETKRIRVVKSEEQ